MIPEPDAITGNEEIDKTMLKLPYAALVAFYKAFNSRDLELMQQNWLHSDEVSMSNPLGGVKRGWDQIKSVYQRIFEGEGKVYVEFYDYTIHAGKDMFVAVGRERGHLVYGKDKLDLQIRTSRVFSKRDRQWWQIHHHGSMDNPVLLEKYQSILINK